MTEEQGQSWETQEEALAALHKYAEHYAEREDNSEAYQKFLDGHQTLEIQQGKFVLALKPGQMPFTYA